MTSPESAEPGLPAPGLTVVPLTGMPEVAQGDDLVALLLQALQRGGLALTEGDVLAISSKVVSKALGLHADPADKAEVVLAQSDGVVAERRISTAEQAGGARVTRVVRSLAGPVMAAAGVDASNTGGRDVLLLLPHDPDAVCRALRAGLRAATGVGALGVVLTDTAGRPWRVGQTDFALGAAGVRVLDDLRGGVDADGRPLAVTARAVADEIAAAADLVKGKVHAIPATLVRGVGHFVTDEAAPDERDAADEAPTAPAPDRDGPDTRTPGGARALVRTGPGDWFALGAQEAVRAALGVPPGSALAHAVGIRPTGADSVGAQVDRAVRVALATGLAEGVGVGVDVGADRLEVTGPDQLVVGMVAARLGVALRGEGVAHTLEVGPGSVRMLLGGNEPGPDQRGR